MIYYKKCRIQLEGRFHCFYFGQRNLSFKFLREDLQRSVYVSGVVEVEVKSVDEAFNVFLFGKIILF